MDGQRLRADQELPGHGTIEMTEAYANLLPNKSHDAVVTLCPALETATIPPGEAMVR